jgi:hypothetical protein
MILIWNFIKPYLIYIILGGIIYLLFAQNKALREDVKRVDNNYQAAVQNSSIQQELTRKEFKEYYSKKLDSIAKGIDIKLKNVTEVVVTKYNLKDTVIKHYETTKVKIYGTESFTIPKGCFTVTGKLDSTGVTLNTITNQDKLTYFLYKSYHKHFLFFKWKPYYQSKIYSECKKDTMSIETNLKIQ